MMRDGSGAPLRLLPWTTPEGAPCYLSTDDSRSRLSRMADELEADLLDSAEFVLTQAKPLLAEMGVGERELRFAGVRLAEALGDALRIAASRGARLPEA
ncbi:hypothetical protein ACFFS2_39185 [Streptomyces aurantiacus]|uniref:Uncharacterized protein n=1 Tax=Streptomyces aurantiacus TaxID=47760 RepID=A0A7G1PBP7_9ACTN|nr:hypothetical protein [Streptomyces aurantiacus]BCL31180.1 hypothetical protein GCM10017557_60390 [Streptomyces aurantiacus]